MEEQLWYLIISEKRGKYHRPNGLNVTACGKHHEGQVVRALINYGRLGAREVRVLLCPECSKDLEA